MCEGIVSGNLRNLLLSCVVRLVRRKTQRCLAQYPQYQLVKLKIMDEKSVTRATNLPLRIIAI